jgi:hypothetical protein
MAIDTPDSLSSSTEAPKHGPRLAWLIAVAVGIVIAVLIGAATAARGGDSSNNPSLTTPQLASMQEACIQWHDGYVGDAAPPSAWCDDMIGWMTGQLRGGHMMGPMMWSDPDQLRSTCQAWLRSGAGGGGTHTTAWCSQMVEWMTAHMGAWDRWDQGWMMNGPMMGR